MDIHQPIRTMDGPDQPAPIIRGICGYESTNPKEFREINRQPPEVVTCVNCQRRLTERGYRCYGGMDL